MPSPEEWLAEALVALADTSLSPFDDPDDYWKCLVGAFTRLIEPSSAWLLALDEHGRLRAAASSDEQVESLAELEARAKAGPGFDCARTGTQLVDIHLDADPDRWPHLVSVAHTFGYQMAHAFPLVRHSSSLGSITVFTTQLRPLDDLEVRIARTLADTATIGMLQRRAIVGLERTSSQLKDALRSRVVIEQAKGVVATKLDVSIPVAFELLRDYSRDHNRKLGEVAQAIVERELATRHLVTHAKHLPPGFSAGKPAPSAVPRPPPGR